MMPADKMAIALDRDLVKEIDRGVRTIVGGEVWVWTTAVRLVVRLVKPFVPGAS